MRINHRRGAMLPLAAVSMVGVMTVMAFAVDVGALQRQRRMAQTAADAGALAGADEIYRGRSDLISASANTETTRNGFTHGASNVAVTVSNAPVSGFYVGNAAFVEVRITRSVPMFFGNLVGRTATTVAARAVAGAGAQGENCVYTMDPDDEKSLYVSGSTTRLTVGCGLIVNSAAQFAVDVESGGTLAGPSLGVTGGIDQSGGTLTITGSAATGIPPSPDPLRYLPAPTFSLNGCDYTNTKISSGVTQTLNPGIYCGGLEIDGTANLNSGLYILRGGGLKMGSGTINGAGVTFFNTNHSVSEGGADKFGKLEMGSASRANLSAMTTGPLAGILFYQDPTAGKVGDVYNNLIASGSNAVLTGTLYFPTQPVELGASGSTTTVNGGVVAQKVTVTSGSRVTITAPSVMGPTYFPFKRISLVE